MAKDGRPAGPTDGTPDTAARIGAALDRLAPAGGRLGVAVSGGGDSMALLAIATGWAGRRGRDLAAATVDHGLRSASAAEAAFAGAFCARIGVPHRTLRAGPIAPGNLPAAARAARYDLLAGWAREEGLAAVLLGHTMDDQAETLLMRLARGSGVEGLSGMAPRRDAGGVAWLRPALGVRRAALRDWLAAQGIVWVDDPTNEDAAHDRVKARRALATLAPLGITAEGLAATAGTLARQRRVLVRAAAEVEAASVVRGPFGEAWLALEPLRRTERDTALRVFAGTLARVAGQWHRPRFRAVEPALEALLGDAPRTATLGGCLVVPGLGGDRVLICRELAAAAPKLALRPPATLWDGRWRLTAPAGVADADGRHGEGWHVGALGQDACDRLARAARAGDWQPPDAWAAAPRLVREAVPAIFADESAAEPAAVPSACYVAPGAPAGMAGIHAELAPAGDGAW